ncbi:SHOCT domain-containing protein [Nisaea sp.]|uniref:SHOCT domain-containing protein n=1 Tax=Nisaea sp. TaxID=2024842 RepID=UPI003B5231FB
MQIRHCVWSLTAFTGAVALSRTAAADSGDSFYGDHMMYGGWFMGPFMMLVALGLIVVAIVVVTRLFGTAGGAGSALRILEERFARGEIDREEFEERKKALSR